MTEDKKTLKFQMMMSPSEAELLDDWMFEHRVRSRAEAIRLLWAKGLNSDKRSRDTLDLALSALATCVESLSEDSIPAAKAIAELAMFSATGRATSFDEIEARFGQQQQDHTFEYVRSTLSAFVAWLKKLQT